MILASNETIVSRWETCQSCEHLNGNRCNKCGCYMPAKIRLAMLACPIEKWKAEFTWKAPWEMQRDGDHRINDQDKE